MSCSWPNGLPDTAAWKAASCGNSFCAIVLIPEARIALRSWSFLAASASVRLCAISALDAIRVGSPCQL
jgi:hypothetical protein